MKKLKDWIVRVYLPRYARETVWEENRRLREENAQLKAQALNLIEYINGMQMAMKLGQKITIDWEGRKE